MPKGKNKKAGSNLGRSIIRQQFAPTMSADDRQLLETERGKHQLRSGTQCDDMAERMSNAMLAGTDFTAKRGEVVVLGQEVHASAVHEALADLVYYRQDFNDPCLKGYSRFSATTPVQFDPIIERIEKVIKA